LKRIIDGRHGERVEVEVEDEYPRDEIEEMMQLLWLAKHIHDNREKYVGQTWLPPYKPMKRKKGQK
jgi:hypothetical protein